VISCSATAKCGPTCTAGRRDTASGYIDLAEVVGGPARFDAELTFVITPVYSLRGSRSWIPGQVHFASVTVLAPGMGEIISGSQREEPPGSLGSPPGGKF
jgi:hypothetical protein